MSLFIACTLSGATAFAQLGQPYPGGGQYPGGQYPGGQYPGQQQTIGGSGIPFPGRSKKAAQSKQVTDTVTGNIRRISTTELILEPEDRRIITVSLEKTTQYFTNSGAAKYGDFDAGDQVSIDASRDTNSYLHAVKVTLEKKGGPAETSAAAQPRAQVIDGDETVVAAQPATTVAPPALPRDADDPGPPVLRHGAPPPNINAASRGQTSEPAPVARVQTARAMPPPVMASQPPAAAPASDAVIAGARETAVNFSETLPNYEVKQFTARFQTGAAQGDKTQWQALDVVSADVVYENGKESYKNLQINGKTPKGKVEDTGAWSTGEFASVLQDVLSPATDADFYNKRSATIVNRASFRYDYTVEQPNSHWTVIASAEKYRPGYKGSIWVDKENSRVLRIEMIARNIPKEFPLDKVESVTEYDYVLIGSKKFLLPTHSESMSCVSGSPVCTKNVIDFRNYRKYGADSEIKFDPN